MLLHVIIVSLLILWLVLALRHLNRKDENGQRIHSCGCSCANCTGCHLPQSTD